jgi:Lon protease-like protein
MEAPLFPLHTVLYPRGPLPLRIFEKRYIDMISHCMKTDSPFGVLLIKKGNETGPAETCDVGTLAKIVDWYQGSDGLLGVTAIGQQKFRVISTRRQDDGLMLGTIETLPVEPACPLPEKYRPLAVILSGVIDDLGRLYDVVEKDYDDAGWLGYRFAEILPMTSLQKQACLETDDPIARLESMRAVLESVRL